VSRRGPQAAAGARGFTIEGHRFAAPALAPGLYVVATPIGNLEDVTLRALKVLAAADRIACEDTRITSRLLARYAIAAPLAVYSDRTGPRARPQLLAAMEGGAAVALVSDAGTPLISDPGFKLVRAAQERGLKVVAVPGASALTAAASIAGLATDRLHFAGFLPARAAARAAAIAALRPVEATVVLYEAPGRLAATLADLAAGLGERRAAVARELTKLHEELVRGSLAELAQRFADRSVKGEIAILIEAGEATVPDAAELDAALTRALAAMSVRDAAAAVAGALGLPRARVYARALELAKGGPP